MTCQQCNKQFISERKTAQFCSSKCRMTFNYKDKVSVESPDKVSVESSKTLSVESMSDKDRIGKKIKGYCHGCGQEAQELICICLNCIGKDVTHKSLGLKMCG